MARIRVRFELNKGGRGAPLDKLAEIAAEAERFLRTLADDLRLENRKGEWLAVDFKNSSVSFDATFEGVASEAQVSAYIAALDAVTAYDPDFGVRHPDVSDGTLIQYARLGQRLAPHEQVGIGLYDVTGERVKEWRYATYGQANRVQQALEAPIVGHGSLQGIIHALYKEAERPYFHLRELSTQELVKCEYPPSLYGEVWTALRDRRITVHVAGQIRFDRARRAAVELRVERIESIEPMSDEEFERFFGCAPTMTGDLSTEEHIEAVRAGRE